jgi:hypothetical protein
MGTGFTVDTPLRIARFGISSVISLVDDELIEQMRQYHCAQFREPYEPITAADPDARARRITAYLDMVDRLVKKQLALLKAAPFEPGSEITRYYELLPASALKDTYLRMLATPETEEKTLLQEELRQKIVAGSIDVNIMTKLDVEHYENGEKLPAEYADAMAALRGFALSTTQSAIVFSAGINQRLYTYAARFDGFFPDAQGRFKKRIIVKVSDYRSALIQGKFLAKRGLWVSEFRIESGLNCGGHAFAAECNLIGPVLEQFKNNRQTLQQSLYKIYSKTLTDLGRPFPAHPLEVRITAQGGIGTAREDRFLLRYYHIDGTGWGTPFMLVPEVTNVDPMHIEKLCNARREDIYLSNASPLGVAFWNLRTSASEEKRRQRIENGKPGSPCPKSLIALNTEFIKPLCTASRAYISQKLKKLREENLPAAEVALIKERILEKSCICHDLAGSVSLNYNTDPKAAPAVCCGPNIRNFNRIFSLEEMVNHIYGRLSIMVNSDRPHMFIEEIRLNLDYLRGEIKSFSQRMSNRPQSFFETFKAGLLDGIDYYRGLTRQFIDERREKFLEELKNLQDEIESTYLPGKCEPDAAVCNTAAR